MNGNRLQRLFSNSCSDRGYDISFIKNKYSLDALMHT
jgi:hypothetical protein